MAQAGSSEGLNVKTGIIGKMKVTAFNSLNAKGAALVKAIKPTKTALDKVTNPPVKLLAQSEVDEQTTIAAKLKEVATAKGVTLPAEPDAATDFLLSQMNSLSGAELDAFYVA